MEGQLSMGPTLTGLGNTLILLSVCESLTLRNKLLWVCAMQQTGLADSGNINMVESLTIQISPGGSYFEHVQ